MKRNDNNNREKLLEDIIDRVNYGSIILHGVRKISETALLPQIEKRLSKSFIFVYVDLEDTKSKEEFFKKIVSRVLEVCRPHLDVSEPRITELKTENYFIELNMRLGEIIHKLNGESNLILLLDGVDTTKIYIQEALYGLRYLIMAFVGQLHLIMAGVIVYEYPEIYRGSSPWYNVFWYIDATPFVEENANPFKSLLQKFVAILHKDKGETQP